LHVSKPNHTEKFLLACFADVCVKCWQCCLAASTSLLLLHCHSYELCNCMGTARVILRHLLLSFSARKQGRNL